MTDPGSDPVALDRALRRLDGLIDWERRERAPARGPKMEVDLEPVRELIGALGLAPQRLFAIHVAGSKGKGSVCALVAAALGRAGLAVGRYGSPHVERVTERIVIGGEEVRPDLLAASLMRAMDVREEALGTAGPAADATWFDILTAAAFELFEAAKLDAVVVECGLGGRLDSTNVLGARVCVLTNVELEHTSILGDTLEAIAAEKAAIAGPGSVLVAGVDPNGSVGRVVAEVAGAAGARTVFLPPRAGAVIDERNRALAAAALDEAGRAGLSIGDTSPVSADLLDPAAVAAGRLPGRLERFCVDGVAVVLDGAHTERSVELVLAELEADIELEGPPVVILGLGRDKDASAILKLLRGRVDSVLCTSIQDGPRALPGELQRLAHQVGLPADAVSTPEEALQRAIERAKDSGWVLVLGSLHLAGAFRPLLR